MFEPFQDQNPHIFGTVSLTAPKLFFSLHGNGDTIGINQEIQCLLYARFFNTLIKGPINLPTGPSPVPLSICSPYSSSLYKASFPGPRRFQQSKDASIAKVKRQLI